MKTVDMTEDMEKDAIEQAVFAMNEFVREVDMAAHIKKEFDKKYRCVEPPHDRLHQCLGLASSSLHAVHSDARKTATAARHLLNPHLACVCSRVAHQPPRGPSSFTRHRAAPPFVDPCRLLPPLRSPTWHVVVGTNYGSHVVHQTKNFVYFHIGQLAFLVFKSG